MPSSVRFLSLSAGALLVSAVMAVPAAAQGCRDQADRLAAALGLDAAPPPAGSSGATNDPAADGALSGSAGLTSDRLARSGGVVTPPATGDGGVIAPPPQAGATMPTAPAVRSAPGEDGAAARRAQMESLLTAARAAAAEGDEARCLTTLDDARGLAAGAARPRQGG